MWVLVEWSRHTCVFVDLSMRRSSSTASENYSRYLAGLSYLCICCHVGRYKIIPDFDVYCTRICVCLVELLVVLLCIIIIIIIIISTTMFMVLSSWQSHCKSSPGSFDECRMAPSGRRPKTKPDDLGCESAFTGCQKLHPPSPFIITQPESWYSFYSPTEGRRLSRPSWLVTYRDGLPVHRWSPIRVLTGSDIAQLRWSKPTCYH